MGFFSILDCAFSSECEEDDEQCFEETCGALLAMCMAEGMLEGACSVVMFQSPEVVEEELSITAAETNDFACPSAEGVGELLDIVDAAAEITGDCDNPTFSGTDSACTVDNLCVVEGQPSTDTSVTFNLDGTVEMLLKVGITFDEQSIECVYQASGIWTQGEEE